MTSFFLKTWDYFLVISSYVILSAFLAIITSGGWSTLVIAMGAGVLAVLSIIIILGQAIFRNTRNVKKVSINNSHVIILLVMQAIALLFNIGDCGDASGSYFFYERILGNTNLCGVSSSHVELAFTITFFAIYSIMFILFSLYLCKSSSEEMAKTEQLPKVAIVVLRTICVLAIIAPVLIVFTASIR